MYDFFPQGVSVITVVVLGTSKEGKIVPVQKFRLAKSRFDWVKFPHNRDGSPVLGARVYRERTKAELRKDGLEGQPYELTLVPLCNVPGQEPWLKLAA